MNNEQLDMDSESMGVRDASARYQFAAVASPLVPPGYKQTEVGVIPKDWNVASIGQCLKIRHGKNQHDVACTNGDYPILATGGEIGRASRPLYSRSSVLIGRKGTIDVPRYAEDPFWSVDTLFYSEVEEKISPKFMFYKFCMVDWYSYNEASGVPSLNAKTIENIAIAIPSTKAEQESIANALSDVDALLAKLDQLIAKKRDLKQAAMQQLLTGQTRLPGFSGEWVVTRLGDVVDKIVGGGTPSRSNPNYWGNEIPWVTVKDFATFNPRESQEAITQEGLKQSASNLIPKGTLITSTRMALGKAVIYEVDVSINQDLKAIFPKRNVSSKFLYYWFEYYASVINDLGSGSTVKGISLADLKAIEFKQPKLEEQTAIATLLSDTDAEITALEARRDKTRALKQGMMQELLTGRIRLL